MAKHKPSNLQIAQQIVRGERREDDLSPAQEIYWKKIRMAYGLMIQAKPHGYVLGAIMQLFDISQISAWRIKKEAELLFGDMVRVNKDIHRQIAAEMALKSYNLAFAQEDPKAMNGATRAYIEATGCNQDDPELPDFAKIQPSIIAVVLPEGIEHRIDQLLQSGAINLNKIPETIDIAHEDIGSGAAD